MNQSPADTVYDVPSKSGYVKPSLFGYASIVFTLCSVTPSGSLSVIVYSVASASISTSTRQVSVPSLSVVFKYV